jgi:hypothetical protein
MSLVAPPKISFCLCRIFGLSMYPMATVDHEEALPQQPTWLCNHSDGRPATVEAVPISDLAMSRKLVNEFITCYVGQSLEDL